MFWALAVFAALLVVLGAVCVLSFIRRSITSYRDRKWSRILQPLIGGLACALSVPLVGVLLTNESVYYFGLGNALPQLAWIPFAILLLTLGLLVDMRRGPTSRTWPSILALMLLAPFGCLLGYWGLLWP